MFPEFHCNSLSHSEDIKILFFNINYSRKFFEFLTFPCYKKTDDFQHVTVDVPFSQDFHTRKLGELRLG